MDALTALCAATATAFRRLRFAHAGYCESPAKGGHGGRN